MRRSKNYFWTVLAILIWVFIFATLPRAIASFNDERYNFEFEFLPIGVVPVAKSEFEASTSALLADLTATHLQVTDLTSGAVLLANNATGSAFPASTTKMLTALVAKEIYSLDDIVVITKEAVAEDNLLRFKIGEKILAGDLIKGMLINSSNESAEALALNYAGGREGFVDLMNQKARALHLDQSLFVNPAGFDQENIYSSARDLTILAKELLQDRWLKEVVATTKVTINEASGSAKHHLTNTNELLFELPEVQGVKTGTTDGAGQVLVTLIEKDGHQILIVVMGSTDRYLDTKKIITWVSEAFDWVGVDFNNLIN